jgi:RNA polymerase sigma factor (sigma-70 family)
MKEATAPAAGRRLSLVGDSRYDFRALYDRHYDAILAYFLRRSGRAVAQDLTAEVFMVAWRRIEDVPLGDDASLWLYRVASNVAAHQRRSAARGARLETRLRSVGGVEHDEEPELQVVRSAEYARVIAAASRLRPVDQEILRLAAWEELPHRQIASLLGISVGAVDQRLHRAKKRLAREFGKRRRPIAPQTREGERP